MSKKKLTAEKKNIATEIHELIFYHAVKLQQSGRLRSLIFCQKSCIYILNQDHTVLLRFPLTGERYHFKSPISFTANDYDSNEFIEKNSQIIFQQKHGKYLREKACQVPNLSCSDVSKIYKKQMQKGVKKNRVALGKDFLKCIDAELTHLEFKGVKGKLICKQRNLYSGSVITVTKKSSGKKLFASSEVQSFAAIGLRTADFEALYSFADVIYFYFAGKDTIVLESKDANIPFTGIISRCVYDEIGVDKNGR